MIDRGFLDALSGSLAKSISGWQPQGNTYTNPQADTFLGALSPQSPSLDLSWDFGRSAARRRVAAQQAVAQQQGKSTRTPQDNVNQVATNLSGDPSVAPEASAPEDPNATRPSGRYRLPFSGRYEITGNFGESDEPYPGDGHRGMDFGLPEGTDVQSVDDGEVVAAGDLGGGYGNAVLVRYAWGDVLYGHLSNIGVKTGDRVSAGGSLGASGSTGKSTGPHLHFETRRGGTPFDPREILDEMALKWLQWQGG